jgi:DNA-binding transcriptional LysR family regulator
MDRLPEMDGLQSFLLVAEELSFRKAAERLNLDQSALSRRIKELEARIGVRLFLRTTREVRMTEAGQAFYERNIQLIDALRDSISLAQRTANGASGRLRVGYMSFAAIIDMPQHVRSFREMFPRVSLDLLYSSTQAQKVELMRNMLDVGFMIGPFRHPDYDTSVVSEERLVALFPAGHPAVARGGVTVAELSRLPLVLGTSAQWDFYRKLLHTIFESRGLKMNVAFEASSSMGMLGLVAGGLGSTIFPGSIRHMQPTGIEVVEIKDCTVSMQTILAWRKTGLSVTTRNFLRVCGANSTISPDG